MKREIWRMQVKKAAKGKKVVHMDNNNEKEIMDENRSKNESKKKNLISKKNN